MSQSARWERARRSSRRYELLVRDGQYILCRVHPWAELRTYSNANQAAIDRLHYEQGTFPPDHSDPGPDGLPG